MDKNLLLARREREIEERLSPKPGDRHYLHLADLLVAVKEFATSEIGIVLDYGAGLSPYRSLFPNCQYRRADLPSTSAAHGEPFGALERDEFYPDPDYVILADGRIAEQSATFDLILSTQVLEHVRDPEAYLSESFRLLRPGGKLFLTTHGSWEDHGCPYDFRRWTADGLKYDLEKVGFTILNVKKLTTGPRAMLWFLQYYLSKDRPSRRNLLGLCHWLCRFVPKRWIHIQADRLYPNRRVVPAGVPGNDIYLCLAICAQRPGAG
jgi:SAM-dependent methyltransferase